MGTLHFVDERLISQNSFYILGTVVVSWVNFGCSYMTGSWQWVGPPLDTTLHAEVVPDGQRTPYIIQIPLALAILVGTQFVPETPRFHIAKDRHDLALDFFAKYHGNGNPDDELVKFEYTEVCNAIELEREAKAEKWSTILRDPSSRHRLGLAALMTFLTNVSSSRHFHGRC